MDMSEEIWRTKPEWEGYYEFSNYGRCRSLDRVITHKDGKKVLYKGKVLSITKEGFVGISINGQVNQIPLCNIIAELFIPDYDENTSILFKDGNKANCSLDNLQLTPTIIEGNWRKIEGYEGYYQVSSDGRVKSLPRWKLCGFTGKPALQRERILKPGYTKDGYAFVNLSKPGEKGKPHYVHRLVAQAFIPNPNNYPMVNHKDENPANNDYTNLEWCTHQYNINYGTAMERASQTARDNNPNIYNRPIINITTGEQYNSIDEVCTLFGYNRSNIKECCEGIRDTSHNYNWRYLDDEKYEVSKSKYIICIETGEEYKNAAQLAKAIGVTPAAVSKHLNEHLTHLKGLHYTYKEAGKEYTIPEHTPKRMGRPPKENKEKYKPLFIKKYKPNENKIPCHIQLTPQDKLYYKKLAKEAGMPLSDFIAQVLYENLYKE